MQSNAASFAMYVLNVRCLWLDDLMCNGRHPLGNSVFYPSEICSTTVDEG